MTIDHTLGNQSAIKTTNRHPVMRKTPHYTIYLYQRGPTVLGPLGPVRRPRMSRHEAKERGVQSSGCSFFQTNSNQ